MYMLPMFADAKLIVYSDIFLFFNKINTLHKCFQNIVSCVHLHGVHNP